MAATRSKPIPWSEAEDHYLISNRDKLTPRMMADDLERSLVSVQSRIKELRKMGVTIAKVPVGRPSKRVTPPTDVVQLVTDPALPLSLERDMLADEVSRHLAMQVDRYRLDAKTAADLFRRIQRNVIQAPEHAFSRYSRMSVDEIVRRAA